MEIRLCTDKKQWDETLLALESAEFLQSWEWGEFQDMVGNAPIRLLVQEGGVEHCLQFFIHKLPLGWKYLYGPRVDASVLKLVISNWKLVEKALGQKLNFVFSRIEASQPVTNYHLPITNAVNRQPQTTLILDLTKTEDQLLSEMHQKTRYNISLAERKGIVVKQGKNIEIFWKLNQETGKRDEFKTHGKDYYEKMLNCPLVYQLTAYYNNEPVASNICVCFAGTFTYLHGASSNEYRNLMAPYLLQWEGIKLARKLDCKFYDFWGISPKAGSRKPEARSQKAESCFHNLCWQADHPWTGVTRFKVGFGGLVREYPEAVDVVFKKGKYRLYQLVKKIMTVISK